MDDFAKLELSTETLRDLTDDELSRVAGGAGLTGTGLTAADTSTLGGPTGTFLCPSGRTWTANCQITIATG